MNIMWLEIFLCQKCTSHGSVTASISAGLHYLEGSCFGGCVGDVAKSACERRTELHIVIDCTSSVREL